MNAILTACNSTAIVESLGAQWVNELFDRYTASKRLTLAHPFDAELQRQIRAYQTFERQTTIAMIDSLEATRRQVINVIRNTPAERWNAIYLRGIVDEIDNIVVGLQTSWANTLTVNAENIYSASTEHVIDLVKLQLVPEAAATIFLPGIPLDIITATSDYYAAYITGITHEARAAISRIVSANVAAGGTISEAVPLIGRNLTDRSIFKSLRHRAETIAKTETTRIKGQARNLNQQRMEKLVPGLRKAWIATFVNTRESHATAAAVYNEEGAIPIAEAFIVGDSALMYPGDPAGSPGEIINCACDSYEVVPDEHPGKKQAA